jgi:hypothetical protein
LIATITQSIKRSLVELTHNFIETFICKNQDIIISIYDIKKMKFLPLLLSAATASPSKLFHHDETFHHQSTISRSLAKEATITKTFKFKDDFFVRLDTLPRAMGAEDGEELLAALEDYGEEFRDVWVDSLMDDLDDNCAVVVSFIAYAYFIYMVCVVLLCEVLHANITSCFYSYQYVGNVHPQILHL